MEKVRYETQVLNYGGGKQTVALCVMIAEGVLPRPDHIVIADTSREVQSTWNYIEDHAGPYLAKHDLKIEVAPHELATVDLYSHQGTLLLPVFTADGKFSSYCSGEWKTQVMRRYLRSVGVKSATQWIGYAFDEKRRWMKAQKGQEERRKAGEEGPWRMSFPLVELMLTQADCPVIIRKAGLPVPSKSRCWMCPNQPNVEWRELRDESPEEFEKACVLDEEAREEDFEKSVYLHESRVQLREADLDVADRKEPSRQCTLGTCFI